MEKSSITSGIQLKSVILQESILQRESYLEQQHDLKFNVQNSGKTRENFLDAFVSVSVDGTSIGEGKDLRIAVTMIGTFEKVGDFPLSDEEFLGINAPAIVYPFIRQHIRTLSLEAGIGTILLPTINFQALYNQKEETGEGK